MNQQTTRPQTATEILKTAASTLGERGKQYDQAGKQERSMTAIVAAFNAIYPRNLLTVHMGWQFMSLVKMVRGATKPHADSALDQVAYAALAAEEVAEQLHSQEQLHEAYAQPAEEPTKYYVVLSQPELYDAQKEFIMEQVLAGHIVQIRSDATARRLHLEEELEEEPKDVETINQLKAELAEQSDNTSYWRQLAIERAVELSKQSEREQLDIETINDLRTELASCKAMTAKFQAERKANVAMHEEVTRLRGKVQELADLAEYRDKRNAELCAELSRAQDEIQSLLAEKRNLTARNKELEDKVQSLNNEVEAKVRELMSNLRHEAPCAHNTDEPKAPRPEYVDPFDQYGDIRSPMHRTVGGHDPARGGLAYPAGKDAPTPQ